ncbi:MAG: TVP38/TMEM64 family protein [Clostridia bacterium]|nr:TVP38/TMEM64 family protein [Clostridia bacterium]
MRQINKKRIRQWLFFSYFLLILILTVVIFKYFKVSSIKDFEVFIKNQGIFGALILLLVQVLQVLICFVPGEAVEFLSGAMFGAWLGLLIDLTGIFIGQTIIYFLVKALGKDAVYWIEKINRLEFLKNEKKLYFLLFLLFFIPGTPKDTLCYVVPLFKIPFKPYMIISIIARIPSVLSSTFAGSVFRQGDVFKTAIVYAGIAIISVTGIFINQYLMKGKRNGTDHKGNCQ